MTSILGVRIRSDLYRNVNPAVADWQIFSSNYRQHHRISDMLIDIWVTGGKDTRSVLLANGSGTARGGVARTILLFVILFF